ncbi:hypothetical protein CC86DRAFT_289834 [Ophiobolus disseminans]|uniref:Heterokaryon incompatibility domain-containing protein n=1 Tax=Ophiobolus disseminans TaxID=1469910 RepID=A0A6A7A5I5_9PLEO|nr:hypothetical protein CC86DRAFT_289834 [Ophiobolus disseminans]
MALATCDSTTTPPFLYEPLTGIVFTIRLLEVLPIDKHGAIRVRLWHTPLQEAGDYRCLSYIWGDPLDTTYEISLNGHSFYVSRTADIYRGATETYIWFGNDGQADEALALLNQNNVDLTNRTILSHIADLYSHSYWRRTWICQEMLLSKVLTVHTSRWTLNWDKFQTPIADRGEQFAKHRTWFPPNPEYFWSLWNDQRYAGDSQLDGHHSIWDLMEKNNYSQCADPRDHAYALLSGKRW